MNQKKLNLTVLKSVKGRAASSSPIQENSGKFIYICAILLAFFSGLVLAEPQVPNSGILLQQNTQQLPETPTEHETYRQPKKPSGVSDETPFVINKITFTGNSLIDDAALYKLIQGFEGKKTTLSKLQAQVYMISDHYHDEGYPFARAVIPAQTIKNGEVEIQIIEPVFGEVKLKNGAKIKDTLLNKTLSILKPGEPITHANLERALLLLRDKPGAHVKTTIAAGDKPGTSDVVVELEHKEHYAGHINLDDYGNTFNGRPRAGLSLSLFNPANHGDVLSFQAFTSGQRMQFANLAYDIQADGHGTHVGASYSAMRYSLGKDLAPLGVHGDAKTLNVWVKHPIIRSRADNIYAQLDYNETRLNDKVDAAGTHNTRRVRHVELVLNGDFRDQFISPSVNTWRISYARGHVDIQDPESKANDALAKNTQGNFSKVNINVTRLQHLKHNTTLWLSYSVQRANDNLDSSQQMVFGGPFSVRAYDNGAVSGDNGQIATVEVRHLLSQKYGTWQGVIFADMAHVEVNDQPWAGYTEENEANLSGVGVGLNWRKGKLSAKATVATSIGASYALTEAADKTFIWTEVGFDF